MRVKIRGLREFRSELRRVDLHKDLRVANKLIADLVADKARGAAPESLKKAIRPRGTQRGAFVDLVARPPRALGVFLGMRRRSGWYAHPRYSQSRGRQFAPWVGNQWVPGATGGKPYFVGEPINRAIPQAIDLLGDEIEQLAKRAFPD